MSTIAGNDALNQVLKEAARLLAWVVPLILLLGALLPANAARQALVVGNDNYTHVSKLLKAGNDANAMARELRAAGFTVQLHRDLNYRSMVRAIELFTSGIKGGDEVVVFFAGHGVQIKTGAYLLPTDIEATSESEVQQTAYELNLLTEKLSEAKAAFSLVIVDACRDNPLKVKGRSLGNSRGLSAVEPPKGQMIVYSASRGQQALDRLSERDTNPNSVFTREFIARMKKPGVRIEDLVREVQDVVEALASTVKHEQRPAMYNEARGNFYFFGPVVVQTAPPKVEPADIAAQAEQQGWAAAQKAHNESGYNAYLREYPNGRFAAAARIAIASLGGPAPVSAAVGRPQPALPGQSAPVLVAPTSVVQPPPTSPERITGGGSAPLKIAFVYVGPVGDGGWTFAHDNARKAVEREFGERVVTSVVEKVPETAHAERVFRDLASQGNKLIFGTSFGFMEPMLKVAAIYPSVRFEHATGYKTGRNMRSYDSRGYEGAFMAGVVAGKMTKSNLLGFVASIPIPEVIRNINSFTLGAQSVNPKIRTKVVWVNEWFNPPKEAEAAQTLINAGADILMQNTDSDAVLRTAERKGKHAFGWDSDMTAYGPKAHLGSVINNWAPYYIKATKDVLLGTWQTGSAWWGVKEGAVDLVSLASDIPDTVKYQINEIKTGLKSGEFVIWKGPIAGQDGRLVLRGNESADDKFLAGMMFYVRGVEGSVPGSKN